MMVATLTMGCRFGGECKGATFSSEPGTPEELQPAIVPKGDSCVVVPGPKTVTWHRPVEDMHWLIRCMMADPPAVEEVLHKLAMMQLNKLSANKRKKLAAILGWTHEGFLAKLAKLYKFDLVKDVIPDLMHLIQGLVKDLVHITVSVLDGWKGMPKDNPCGVNTWENGLWTSALCKMFRSNVHPGFARGRRFMRDFTHAAVSKWSVEECLVFLRLQWRFFIQQFYDLTPGKQPELLTCVARAWELLEAALLPYLNRGGNPKTDDQLMASASAYQAHLVGAKLDGRRVFSLSYMTTTVHKLSHLHKFLLWWGNLTEHWCFKQERMAGEMTQMLTGWTHGEAAAYISNRLELKRASMHLLRKQRCLFIVDRTGSLNKPAQ